MPTKVPEKVPGHIERLLQIQPQQDYDAAKMLRILK